MLYLAVLAKKLGRGKKEGATSTVPPQPSAQDRITEQMRYDAKQRLANVVYVDEETLISREDYEEIYTPPEIEIVDSWQVDAKTSSVEEMPLPEEVAAPEARPSAESSDSYERKVQIALQKAGFYKGALDGVVKGDTHEAIKAFQRANHLTEDGMVGTKTWERLKKFYYETE